MTPTPSRAPLLEIAGLRVSHGKAETLHEISMTVSRKEFVAVLGRNGAGKTTLLRALAGFVPARGGSVLFEGEDFTRLRPHERIRRGLGISLEGRRVFNRHTVRSNLELGGYINRKRKTLIAQDIEAVFSLFPVLGTKANHSASSLSGGERQMLAIGQALMSRPSLLLLDEPSAGLSPRAVEGVFDALRSMRERGISALIVEQAVQQALAVADRGYVLEAGRIILHDRAERLANREEIVDAYIGRLAR